MKIGLIQIDGKMPNLALMKLSKWHRDKGDDVRIIDISSLGIDKWYGSKIFMGGSGYDIKQQLPSDLQLSKRDSKEIDFKLTHYFTSFAKGLLAGLIIFILIWAYLLSRNGG